MSRRNDLLRVQQDIFDTFGVDKDEEYEVATYDQYIECGACHGTGMGRADGSPCQICRGSGDVKPKESGKDYGE